MPTAEDISLQESLPPPRFGEEEPHDTGQDASSLAANSRQLESNKRRAFVLLGSAILQLPIWGRSQYGQLAIAVLLTHLGFAMSYGVFQEYYSSNWTLQGSRSLTGIYRYHFQWSYVPLDAFLVCALHETMGGETPDRSSYWCATHMPELSSVLVQHQCLAFGCDARSNGSIWLCSRLQPDHTVPRGMVQYQQSSCGLWSRSVMQKYRGISMSIFSSSPS